MKGKDNEITLELLAKTIFELQRLPKYKDKTEFDMVRIAYDFLDFCRGEMAHGRTRRERNEATNRWLATEPVRLSKAAEEVVGRNGSHYDEVFKEFLIAVYWDFSSDFLEQKQIPSGFLPEMKEEFQRWNGYKKSFSATKSALIGRYPEKKDLIEGARTFLELRSLDL